MNKTENKFSKWCKKQDWFCKKINTGTYTGHQSKQEADFIVANDIGVWFVECKERKGKSFCLNDLTQYRKLKKLISMGTALKVKILFNFYEEEVLVLLNLNEYEQLTRSLLKKSFNLGDIRPEFKFTWRTLKW